MCFYSSILFILFFLPSKIFSVRLFYNLPKQHIEPVSSTMTVLYLSYLFKWPCYMPNLIFEPYQRGQIEEGGLRKDGRKEYTRPPLLTVVWYFYPWQKKFCGPRQLLLLKTAISLRIDPSWRYNLWILIWPVPKNWLNFFSNQNYGALILSRKGFWRLLLSRCLLSFLV